MQRVSTDILSVSFADQNGRSFQLAVPQSAKTGSEYHLTHASERDIRLKLSGTGYLCGTTVSYKMQYDWKNPSGNGSTKWISEFESDRDSLDIYILFRNNAEIRGELEAVFNDGKTIVKICFWLPIG